MEGAERLRRELEWSISSIVDGTAGPGSCQRIGYFSIMGADGAPAHWFFVMVASGVKGAIVGSGGGNAERLRRLVCTRATVLNSRDAIDVRIVEHERSEGIPAGVTWRDVEGEDWEDLEDRPGKRST